MHVRDCLPLLLSHMATAPEQSDRTAALQTLQRDDLGARREHDGRLGHAQPGWAPAAARGARRAVLEKAGRGLHRELS